MNPLFSKLQEGRQEFLKLVADIRPELHRYCARMTGSVIEGEDVVQETLARAYYALSDMQPSPQLRPWLFKIAHNCATDHLRRAARGTSELIENFDESVLEGGPNAEQRLAQDEVIRTAISRFLELVPAQRSAVVLKDVLGLSLEEIALLSDSSLSAVKAALHRGRVRLRELNAKHAHVPALGTLDPRSVRYAALFNAGDWDGLRALLAEDVRLDLVSRTQRTGREPVSEYFTRYAHSHRGRAVVGWLGGRQIIGVMDPGQAGIPRYFIELEWSGAQVRTIRDFHYSPYIGAEAEFSRAAS